MPMMSVLKTRFRVEGLGFIERQGLGFRVPSGWMGVVGAEGIRAT